MVQESCLHVVCNFFITTAQVLIASYVISQRHICFFYKIKANFEWSFLPVIFSIKNILKKKTIFIYIGDLICDPQKSINQMVFHMNFILNALCVYTFISYTCINSFKNDSNVGMYFIRFLPNMAVLWSTMSQYILSTQMNQCT